MSDKVLFVGGNWDLSCGKSSKIVERFSSCFDNVTVYNGGNYKDLKQIIESAVDYDIVLWWANVDNSLPKIRNVKDINYKVMLISSKRNDNKYTFHELLQRSLSLKSNLTIEFNKQGNIYKMRLFDPLGNVWYEGDSIEDCVLSLKDRLNLIKNIRRQSTICDINNNEISKKNFLSEKGNCISIKSDFLEIIREYARIFAMEIFHTIDVKRFLGNASFRCQKGFPSFRDGKYVFVSRRNVDKEYITIDDFVPVYEENNKVYYCGCMKPSVDTPIQVKLYNKFQNINYMIHSHCYIKDAPYTELALPCGALEEVSSIDDVIQDYYDGNYDGDFYVFNLLGHGSIMMSKEPKQLKNIEIIARNIPEIHQSKKNIKK